MRYRYFVSKASQINAESEIEEKHKKQQTRYDYLQSALIYTELYCSDQANNFKAG